MTGFPAAAVLGGPPGAGRPAARILHVVDSLRLGGTAMTPVNLLQRTQGELHHAVCCIRESGPLAARFVATVAQYAARHHGALVQPGRRFGA
jgi:hypothetical protein